MRELHFVDRSVLFQEIFQDIKRDGKTARNIRILTLILSECTDASCFASLSQSSTVFPRVENFGNQEQDRKNVFFKFTVLIHEFFFGVYIDFDRALTEK